MFMQRNSNKCRDAVSWIWQGIYMCTWTDLSHLLACAVEEELAPCGTLVTPSACLADVSSCGAQDCDPNPGLLRKGTGVGKIYPHRRLWVVKFRGSRGGGLPLGCGGSCLVRRTFFITGRVLELALPRICGISTRVGGSESPCLVTEIALPWVRVFAHFWPSRLKLWPAPSPQHALTFFSAAPCRPLHWQSGHKSSTSLFPTDTASAV